jgi:CSLREA domain-containing protein
VRAEAAARLLIILLCILPCSVPAATFVVDTTDDNPGLAACDDDVPNDCSLRGAIGAANALPLSEASTINVPAGTYVLSQEAPCTFSVQPNPETFFTLSHIPLCVSKQVTIQGAGADSTIIDGNQQVRVLFVSASANLP